MEIPSFWHLQQPALSVKSERSHSTEGNQEMYQFCNGNLNFSTATSPEEEDFQCSRKRGAHQMARDPMSHRVIEKRRRDRMNNCLADLSRLIPADYLKKGKGRIEKTEIIEMAIKHMKYLQIQASKIDSLAESSTASQSPTSQDEGTTSSSTPTPTPTPSPNAQHSRSPPSLEGYRAGYQECVSETLHFMVEVEGLFAGDPLCLELVNHLQRHCDKIVDAGKRQSKVTTSSSPNIYYQSQNNADTSSSSSPHSSDTNKDSSQSDQNDVKPFEKKRTPKPSQLRTMLTCPSMSLHNIDYPSNVGNPILYKFKNNIKQRFSEEHDGLKRRRFEIPEIKRRYSDSCMTASPLNSPDLFTSPCASPKPESYPAPKSVAIGIPIFALHANGSFYIPITVDSEILAPFLKELTKAAEENQSYHPVTISVSFPQSLRMLRSPYVKDMLVLKRDAGNTKQ